MVSSVRLIELSSLGKNQVSTIWDESACIINVQNCIVLGKHILGLSEASSLPFYYCFLRKIELFLCRWRLCPFLATVSFPICLPKSSQHSSWTVCTYCVWGSARAFDRLAEEYTWTFPFAKPHCYWQICKPYCAFRPEKVIWFRGSLSSHSWRGATWNQVVCELGWHISHALSRGLLPLVLHKCYYFYFPHAFVLIPSCISAEQT